MEHDEHIEAVEREIGALVAAIRPQSPSAIVPTCPGWTVHDFVSHVTGFCGFWTHVLCEGTGRPKTPAPTTPDEVASVDWLERVGASLVDELRATPPQTEVWTWFDGDHSAAFVARRSANELAVHRYDAQSVGGQCSPIEPALAADGIDELLGPIVTTRTRTGRAGSETMHLHGTDPGIDAEWLVTFGPERIDVRREHAKGDLALRGSASDLELLLYERPPLGDVERLGDRAVLELWYEEFRF